MEFVGRDLGGTGGRVAFVKEFLEFSLEFGATSQNPIRKRVSSSKLQWEWKMPHFDDIYQEQW